MGSISAPNSASSASPFVFSQASAASTWTIAHNLGRRPAGVRVLDSANNALEGFGAEDPDVNTTVLHFSPASAGTAYIW